MSTNTKRPQLFIRIELPSSATREPFAREMGHESGLTAFAHVRVRFVYADPSDPNGFDFYSSYGYASTPGKYDYYRVTYEGQIDERHAEAYARGLYIHERADLPEAERAVRTLKMIHRKLDKIEAEAGPTDDTSVIIFRIAKAVGATSFFMRASESRPAVDGLFREYPVEDLPRVVGAHLRHAHQTCRKLAQMPDQAA